MCLIMDWMQLLNAFRSYKRHEESLCVTSSSDNHHEEGIKPVFRSSEHFARTLDIQGAGTRVALGMCVPIPDEVKVGLIEA